MVNLIQYDAEIFTSNINIPLKELVGKIDLLKVNWIDIEKSDRDIINEISSHFNIHHLITEDIMNVEHLPKFEAFEDHCFLSLKMLRYDQRTHVILKEHVNIVFGHNILITFQEGLPGDVFDQLRLKLEQGKGVIRKGGVEFLLYHALDAIVDNYLMICEHLRNNMEDLEERLIEDRSYNAAEKVITLKRKITKLRSFTVPLWNSLTLMQKEGTAFFHPDSRVYFQDINDHINYLLNFFDRSREMLRDILDLHQANLNNEMNKVMKTLTIVSAIFIPLTFIAGVYGMNFREMPELEQSWGYPAVLALMFVSAGAMFWWMHHKKWM